MAINPITQRHSSVAARQGRHISVSKHNLSLLECHPKVVWPGLGSPFPDIPSTCPSPPFASHSETASI